MLHLACRIGALRAALAICLITSLHAELAQLRATPLPGAIPPPQASPARLAGVTADTTTPLAPGKGSRPRSWPVVLETGRMGLGMTPAAIAPVKPKRETTKHKIMWERRPDCLDHNLQIVIDELAERFGSILVTSTCRTPEHNRRVGGVKNSQHIGGHAVDFYLYGNVRKARAYLRAHRSVGGLGYYGSGRFHVDNGPVRNW